MLQFVILNYVLVYFVMFITLFLSNHFRLLQSFPLMILCEYYLNVMTDYVTINIFRNFIWIVILVAVLFSAPLV